MPRSPPVGFVIKIIVNAVALWVAAAILPGIMLGDGDDSTARNVGTALLVGAILGVINVAIKPILAILSLPLIVLTLGLFLVIVNALMLGLLSWLSDQLDLAFHVQDFFWDAVLGAIIVSIVSWAVSIVIPS